MGGHARFDTGSPRVARPHQQVGLRETAPARDAADPRGAAERPVSELLSEQGEDVGAGEVRYSITSNGVMIAAPI